MLLLFWSFSLPCLLLGSFWLLCVGIALVLYVHIVMVVIMLRMIRFMNLLRMHPCALQRAFLRV